MKEVLVHVELYQLHGFSVLMMVPGIFFSLSLFFGDTSGFVRSCEVLLIAPRKFDLHIFHRWVSVRREIGKPFLVVRHLHAITAGVCRRSVRFLINRAALFEKPRGDLPRDQIESARGGLKVLSVP